MSPVVDKQAVHQQLSRVCNSDEFSECTRAIEFLYFVVDEALAGRAERLSQRVIASELYKRGSDFDPSTDPIVRMQAGRVRRGLEHYYLTTGKQDSIVIGLQKGTYAPTIETNPTTDAALPGLRLEQPLLLVVPFNHISTGDSIEQIAERLAAELAVTLDRFRHFRIMLLPDKPRSDTFIAENLQRACQTANCYIINGTVSQRSDSIHILIRVEDASTGILFWSHESSSIDKTANIDEFLHGFVDYTASVIAEEQGVVAQQEFPKLERVSADKANSYEALLHLYYTERSNSLEQFQKAILALRHALKDSPNDGRLWSGLARVYATVYALELLPELFIPIEEIVDFAHKGVYLGSTGEDAWCIVSFAETIAGNLKGGREAVLTALAKNPDSLYFRDAIGYLMILQGDWEQGAAISRAAVRDNPYVRDVTFSGLWLEAFHREDFVEAYAWSQRYTNKKLFWAHIMDLTALAGMGELEMARRSAEHLIMTRPDFMTIGHRLIRHFVKFEPLARRIEHSLELSGISINQPT